ncbi:cysteine desulfurase family protein [Idiomarina sp. A28L]|uniref:IscS subfamily cysteine desulfurase n=1 Tax=Idiomarina sp. A28L TaxID=1036674 RepID=UPI00021385D0|nr:IscS subfamily cysteine desulfurase [Idiomarina sp. A28L]EGN74735.1 cysteine desulfurase family protein [Idiomarina sp. A28L]
MKFPIYLDYAATTPVDSRVAEKMMQYLTIDGIFGNPASRSHRFGWQAEEAVDEARERVAELLNADPREIVFTSGATEATNLAIKGAAEFNQGKGKHLITVKTEHKATLDTCKELARRGFEITYLDVQSNGVLDLQALRSTIRPDTVLISVMQVNNEIGVIQDIAAIAKICQEQDIIFHVDAAQSVGKMPIDVRDLDIDMLSLSAHKMYGPKGIGALYVRRKPRTQLVAQMHGGGHERGMRSGTLATHQIAGLGEAALIAKQELETNSQRIQALRSDFTNEVLSIAGTKINGEPAQSVPGIVNVAFTDVDGEKLLLALQELAVSSGSACTSASLEPSYVLRAIGLSDELAHSSIRFSIGNYTTAEELDYTVGLLRDVVPRLRQLD